MTFGFLSSAWKKKFFLILNFFLFYVSFLKFSVHSYYLFLLYIYIYCLFVFIDNGNSEKDVEIRAGNNMQDWKQFDYDDAETGVAVGHCPQKCHSFSDDHLQVQSENQVHPSIKSVRVLLNLLR